MTTLEDGAQAPRPKIEVEFDGPYRVEGNVPLVRKTQIVSEYGEPLTWQKAETVEAGGTYNLCRCGHSHDKPFCDCTHLEIGFDGTETADTGQTAERQAPVPGGTRIAVRRDTTLCSEAGFCANRLGSLDAMVPGTGDPQVRAQVMAMIERCPSGSYVYSVETDGPDVEPDLPVQIAVTTEITDQGPIEGPLWVTGGLSIERSDGEPFETRNRVTLCSCGQSSHKPLCDGTHRAHPTYKK